MIINKKNIKKNIFFKKKKLISPLHNRTKKTWPVEIFILKRKDKVKGRINFLKISIFFNMYIKNTGEPSGVKCPLNLFILKNILDKNNDNQSLNLIQNL